MRHGDVGRSIIVKARLAREASVTVHQRPNPDSATHSSAATLQTQPLTPHPPPYRRRHPLLTRHPPPVKMGESIAVIIASALLCIMLVLLALLYRFLPRTCRRQEVNMQEVRSGGNSGGGATNTAAHVATASPQLRAYKKRRLLASFPSLDRLLCHTTSWQEGVTLESGLVNLSSMKEGRSAHAEAQKQENNDVNKDQNNRAEEDNNGNGNKDQNHAEEDGGDGRTPQASGTSAATQTSNARVNSSAGTLAHSILNLVSSIPNISLGAFSQSQSLPNVHGCLAESVATSSGSRDLVVLWSTTLEGSEAGILTSTRLE